ncbi:glycosyltransferase family 4 protein [Spirosoma rhododendri]|uniref:Glycosyltransferase family 4 protein n=1 Tax=Spirosoma rhododendri TaxID=2728024 RepID=A0A7L5DFV2_9BACT|nr:glycosyltransferase family 1 protein [Spirosoma rhododendri]QJD77046.1 glycosyltransferase family 4 protein [Spirosoma rhododendri]
MKHPHTGLYQYCLNLGSHLNQQQAEAGRSPVQLYLPPRRRLQIRSQPYHIIEQWWHSFYQPFLRDCRVWHAPFQLGRIVPDRRRFPRTKVVLTIHDLNVLHEGESQAMQQKRMALTQSLIDRSDALVCISEFTKNDVLTHCRTDDKPIYVIYNGVDPVPSGETKPVDYQPDRPFLLGIGYLNAKKNFHVLLPLLTSNPELELLLIGRPDDPDYVTAMQQQAQAMGVADRLRLLGTVSETDKGWYLRNCRALVHPSLAEGFGLPVLEAMQFGKPVFLSTLTALPEVGGDAAYYFPDFTPEAMQTAYRQGIADYERNARAEAIRHHAARFTWQTAARQYLGVYAALV